MRRAARRSWLVAGATLMALCAIGVPGAGATSADSAGVSPQQAALDAYAYGIPLMEFNRAAAAQTSVTVPDTIGDAPINRFGNARVLADARERVIVQPNNDTLYSLAHLDLSRTALVLHVPAIAHHRYFAFEFLDPYTNVFAYVGTRTTGERGGTFLITGPGFHGRVGHGMRRIVSPYPRAWIVGRTLVSGAGDLAAAHQVQNGYALIPLAAYTRHGLAWRRPAPRHLVRVPRVVREPAGLAFFDALGSALAHNPPPARDAAILRELRRVGVGVGLHPSREHLSAAALAALRAAASGGPAYVNGLKTALAVRSIARTHGWFVPPADIGAYGTDYTLRAVVALQGLAANRPAEAVYLIGITDPSLRFLNAAHDYVVHFPAGQLPPARYFWSLTMYDQNFFLVANPLGRYALGDRSRSLRRNADGSLDIYLQRTSPPGHAGNWLPTPATGNFEITLRLYGPHANVLDGTYTLPPITRQG
jgi:hypothetical protein